MKNFQIDTTLFACVYHNLFNLQCFLVRKQHMPRVKCKFIKMAKVWLSFELKRQFIVHLLTLQTNANPLNYHQSQIRSYKWLFPSKKCQIIIFSMQKNKCHLIEQTLKTFYRVRSSPEAIHNSCNLESERLNIICCCCLKGSLISLKNTFKQSKYEYFSGSPTGYTQPLVYNLYVPAKKHLTLDKLYSENASSGFHNKSAHHASLV